MVVIRGVHEIAEFFISIVVCVGLYVANCNILTMQYPPALTLALLMLCTVMVLNHVRVQTLPPLYNFTQMIAEVLVIYICCQVVMVLFFEPIKYGCDFIHDAIMETRIAMRLHNKFPSFYEFVRQDIWYLIKLCTCCFLTFKTAEMTGSIEYTLEDYRDYQYFPDIMNSEYNMKQLMQEAAEFRRNKLAYFRQDDLPQQSTEDYFQYSHLTTTDMPQMPLGDEYDEALYHDELTWNTPMELNYRNPPRKMYQ